jgi:hypothetical protein
MWLLYCPGCDRQVLVGPRGVCEIDNRAPGDIVVVLRCPSGHRMTLLTGAGNPSRPVRPLSGAR